MDRWMYFIFGACSGAATAMLTLALANWRILRSWTRDQREPR